MHCSLISAERNHMKVPRSSSIFVNCGGGAGILSKPILYIMMLSSVIMVRASSRQLLTATSASRKCASTGSLAWITSAGRRIASPSPSQLQVPRAFWQQQQKVYIPPSPAMCSIHTNFQSSRLFSSEEIEEEAAGIFAGADVTFESLGIQSKVLLERLEKLGHQRPTAVQAATFEALSAIPRSDMTIGAETGSGKTLAYLLPLLDDILQRKRQQINTEDKQGHDLGYGFARAMILVPNKELVQQVARMAMGLSGGRNALIGGGVGAPILESLPKEETVAEEDMVRIAIMPGNLREPNDFQAFRKALSGSDAPVDLVISTPAAVSTLGLNPKNINMFADIATLILDEADMLLDGGYIRALEQVLMGYRRADKLDPIHGVPRTQHVFVAATLPDYGLRSVDAYIQKRFPRTTRVALDGMHNARHYGLSQPTVWTELESKKDRLDHFQELLAKDPSEGGLKGQKIMLFVNSVDDVEGVHAALEDSGQQSLPYHAKMSLDDRTKNLDEFRQYTENGSDGVQILVCTDLASRGVDIPDVRAVVQLQFAGNVVAHLHRMGRCGRAGQRTGRGVVFYNEQERELVEVVRAAEEQQETMTLQGNDVLEVDEEGEVIKTGTVKKAFSRKRGFTKKRKKERQEQRQD